MLKHRKQRILVNRGTQALLAGGWVLAGILTENLWVAGAAVAVQFLFGQALDSWVSRAIDDALD